MLCPVNSMLTLYCDEKIMHVYPKVVQSSVNIYLFNVRIDPEMDTLAIQSIYPNIEPHSITEFY